MKRLFLPMLLLCLAASSCEKIAITEDTDAATAEKQMRTVTFVMKGLEVDYGSRATMASEGLTDLWIWEGQTLIAHKVSSDTDFESPSVTLSIGAHDLTFVASKADGQTWSEGQWKCTKVKDTFGCVKAVTVSANGSRQVEMGRVVAKVQFTIDDAFPATAAKMDASITNYMGLDAGLNGTSAQPYTMSDFNITSLAGQSGQSFTTMVIPETYNTESNITASITIKTSAGATLCTHTKQTTVINNRTTNIKGNYFANAEAQTLSINTAWAAEMVVGI